MTRLLFLPVSRFSVRYTVAKGRAVSELDRLVLRAIKNDSPTLDSLRITFQLPQRPLLENLVTLFHCGWIAMNGHGNLLVTEEGVRALLFRTLPVSMRPVEAMQMILMESQMGLCVAVRGGLRYFSEQELIRTDRWRHGHVIEPVISGIVPDEGVIRGMLPKQKGGWIHSIAPPIPRGNVAYYLPVVADPVTRRILGLPDRWVPLLEDKLLEEAKGAEDVDDAVDLDIRPFAPNALKVEERHETLSEDDLLTDAAAQPSALRAALESAPPGSWIFIGCERINPSWLQEWRDTFTAALLRGVSIDFVWRTIERSDVTEPGEVQLRHQVEVINQSASGRQQRKVLRAGPAATEGRVHFVLVVPPDPAAPFAWIGGYDWLAPAHEAHKTVVSVRIRELETLSKLALSAAALLNSASAGTLSALPETWRELAGRMEGRTFAQDDVRSGNCEVRLLRDREIDASVADLMTRAATSRIRGRVDEPDNPLLGRLSERVDVQSAANHLNAAILGGDTLIVSASLFSGAAAGEATLTRVGLSVSGGPVVEKLKQLWENGQATTAGPPIV